MQVCNYGQVELSEDWRFFSPSSFQGIINYSKWFSPDLVLEKQTDSASNQGFLFFPFFVFGENGADEEQQSGVQSDVIIWLARSQADSENPAC